MLNIPLQDILAKRYFSLFRVYQQQRNTPAVKNCVLSKEIELFFINLENFTFYFPTFFRKLVFSGLFENYKAIIRSSRPNMSHMFQKFIGKLPRQSLYFNKVRGLRPATLLKKRLWHRCFPVDFAKFLRTPLIILSEKS